MQAGVQLVIIVVVAVCGCARFGGYDKGNTVDPVNPNNMARVLTTVPDWVKPDTAFLYDHNSAFVSGAGDDIRYTSPVHLRWQIGIDSTTPDSYTFTSVWKNVEYPLQGNPATFTSTYGVAGELVPWIDPKNPAGSIKTPPGMPYIVGPPINPFTLPTTNQVYSDAVLMTAEIPDTGTMYKLTYDGDTGLGLAYSVISPGEEIIIYYQGTQAA